MKKFFENPTVEIARFVPCDKLMANESLAGEWPWEPTLPEDDE